MKNYSRRELYALGEAFGESATRLKPGGRVYGGGGGAGLSGIVNAATTLPSQISGGTTNFMGNAVGGIQNAIGNVSKAFAPAAPAPAANPYIPAITSGITGLGPTAPAAPAPAAAPFSAATPSPVTPAPTQTPMSQVESQTGITDYARPYVETMLGATQQQLFNYDPYGNVMGLKGYTPYSYDPAAYVAGFSPLQQQAQYGAANLQTPYQAELASGLLGNLIGQAAGVRYQPTSTRFDRVTAPTAQAAQLAAAPMAGAAQTGYAPDLSMYQMGPVQAVGTGSFTDQAQAYMNPYIQQALAPQLAEARRQADIATSRIGGQAAGAGAFGGSRYGIERAQVQSDLARNLANITGQGYNQAFQQAAQQYATDAARQLAAQQANQQAALTTGQQNLAAALGVQQLGAQTGLQTALQNAQMRQQAALANQALAGQYGLQQGQFGQAANVLNAQQGLQAMLANQQARQAANQLQAQQAQYGAGLGLQGLQAAMSGAGQLGGLGSTSLQNQLGVLGAQQQFGALQQQQQQQIIDQAVKNYQTAQQYPYQQLGFMQNMLGGLPLGTTSQQTYQQAPSMAQNLAALGMGAYGLGQLFSNPVAAATAGKTGTAAAGGGGGGGVNPITGILNTIGGGAGNVISGIGGALGNAGSWINQNLLGGLFADGGQVKGYADGGSVESPQNVESIVGQLSDQQLIQAEQAAMSRGDFDQLQAVQREKAMRASERGGIAGAFNQLPAPARTQMMAGGGMVAFAKGKLVDGAWNEPEPGSSMYTLENDDGTEVEDDKVASAGAPDIYRQLGEGVLASTKRLQSTPAFAAATPEQRMAMEKAYVEEMQGAGGESPYGKLKEYLTQAEGDRGQALQQGKGLAALAAMQGMLQPGGFVRGLGSAGGAFAQQYGTALQADRAEKRALANMQFNMADAERKERMGLKRDAREAIAKAEQNRLDAYKAGILKEQATGASMARAASAFKPVAPKAPAQPKESVAHINAIAAGIRKANPGMDEVEVQDQATRQYLALAKSGTSGAAAKTYTDAMKEFRSYKTLNASKVKSIVDTQFGGDEDAFKDDFMARVMQNLPTDVYSAKQKKPASTGVTPMSVPQSMPSSEKDLKKGTLYDTAKGPATWDGKQFIPAQ